MAAELGELVCFSLAAKLADSLETVFIPAGLPERKFIFKQKKMPQVKTKQNTIVIFDGRQRVADISEQIYSLLTLRRSWIC